MYAYRVPNVAEAFDAYVDTPIPHVTAALRRVRDFTEFDDDWGRYPIVKGLTTVINWKSSVNNADMTYNLRVKLSDDLRRGDLLYDPETGTIGMVNWNVDAMIDCKKTQVTACNIRATIKRHMPEVVDDNGMLVTEACDRVIVNNLPCVYSEIYGRYDYGKNTNSPGIVPDQTVEIKVQANKDTLQLRSGDTLKIHDIPHKIMVINRSQLDMSGTYGTLTLICERSETD